ncbi:MAG: hypothetical protein ACOZAJ_00445 [Patescibacteria group bacterium]
MDRRQFFKTSSLIGLGIITLGGLNACGRIVEPEEASQDILVKDYLTNNFGNKVLFAFNSSFDSYQLTVFDNTTASYLYYLKGSDGRWYYQSIGMDKVKIGSGLLIFKGFLSANTPNPLPNDFSDSRVVKVYQVNF